MYLLIMLQMPSISDRKDSDHRSRPRSRKSSESENSESEEPRRKRSRSPERESRNKSSWATNDSSTRISQEPSNSSHETSSSANTEINTVHWASTSNESGSRTLSNPSGNSSSSNSESVSQLTDNLDNLSLADNFRETSLQTMDHNFGEDWRDPDKIGLYMPKRKRPDVWTEKEGDTAELRVLNLFEKLPEYLGESVFVIEGKKVLKRFKVIKLISGREYCYWNTSEEQNLKSFVVGESDYVAITRSFGIINIEVKGKFFYR